MHLFLHFLKMIEQSQIFYLIYLNHVHILKNVIFQEVLHIPYFKIIPTIFQKFYSNFLGPKLTRTLYSSLLLKVLLIDDVLHLSTQIITYFFKYWLSGHSLVPLGHKRWQVSGRRRSSCLSDGVEAFRTISSNSAESLAYWAGECFTFSRIQCSV